MTKCLIINYKEREHLFLVTFDNLVASKGRYLSRSWRPSPPLTTTVRSMTTVMSRNDQAPASGASFRSVGARACPYCYILTALEPLTPPALTLLSTLPHPSLTPPSHLPLTPHSPFTHPLAPSLTLPWPLSHPHPTPHSPLTHPSHPSLTLPSPLPWPLSSLPYPSSPLPHPSLDPFHPSLNPSHPSSIPHPRCASIWRVLSSCVYSLVTSVRSTSRRELMI